jgi:hypothetical protein
MATDTSVNDIVLLEGGHLIAPEELPATLGWTLKPEGLCRDNACIVVPDENAVREGDLVDVMKVADVLDRPAALDETSGFVAIGVPRERRRSALNDLKAPDFTLPDIDGSPVKFFDNRSKKKLLVAFSSW